MKSIFTITLFLFVSCLYSQQIVYKPINPSFIGGNPYNAGWLLSNADAQNDYQESYKMPDGKSELDQFTESLNRQLLNQLSRDLFQQEYGEANLTVGTYSFGSLVVDITPTVGGLNIDIFDTNTGEQTQIIVPN
ncbi:MAG: curli assembly protein CsgF [Flavobacteriia bacterium]|nr:MAG: curli assembly protein CsgF [Flavobacteriia bacterium]